MNTDKNKNITQLNGLLFALNGFHLQHLIRVYQIFKGDIELCIVLGEIAHYNAFHLFPNMGTRSHDTNEVQKSLRGCNAHSISLSSGIPRETVRRKIKKLIEMKYISSDDKKQLLVTNLPGIDLGDFSKETLEIFMNFADRLREERLI